MKFKAVYATDSAGRKIIFEEYQLPEPYERFKRVMLPQVNDRDVSISTKKHGTTTLAALKEKDLNYLVWIVAKSKYSKTIKYAAMRVLSNIPYQVPEDGEEYSDSLFFDFKEFERYAKELSPHVSKS